MDTKFITAFWQVQVRYIPVFCKKGIYKKDPIPRSDIPSQAAYTLGTCQTSMMCRLMAGQICVRS